MTLGRRSVLSRKRQYTGFTLIELLVSMVIGMVMVGALIAVYTNSSSATTAAQAQVQMAEDGQFALRTMVQQIRLAGYNPIRAGSTTTYAFPGNTTSFAIFGCGSNFSNGGGTATVATNPTTLTCNTTGTASHAISISYEADIYNTPPSRTTNLPTDCLGTGLSAMPGPPVYYVVENRFFVSNNRLMCAGSGDFANVQPLVENIESIQFTYGARNPAITVTNVIGGFLTAQQIGPSPASAAAPTNAAMALVPTAGERWARVMAVRVCVIVRSSTPSFPEATGYLGCNPESDSDLIPISDNYLRKAFVSTVLVRNRMSIK
jgi:type IV pilus assembly protein PilW